MPASARAIDSLPGVVAAALARLGSDLATARKRRQQPLREWALRLNVSVPTLMKMEKGDPSVAIGVYATALWMIQRQDALSLLADPAHDLAALEVEVRRASLRGSKRNA